MVVVVVVAEPAVAVAVVVVVVVNFYIHEEIMLGLLEHVIRSQSYYLPSINCDGY